MQALVCEVVRALTKLGIAMAANRPMMATTIMISTRVNPCLREEVVFICFAVSFSVQRREPWLPAGLFIITIRFNLLCRQPTALLLSIRYAKGKTGNFAC